MSACSVLRFFRLARLGFICQMAKLNRGKFMHKIIAITAGITLHAAISSANASSDNAWAEFAKEVGAACAKAASGLMEKPSTIVDPYGSESYGLALVSGKAKGAKQTISTICVFDKQTKKAEVGSELPADQVKIAPKR